MFFTTLRLGLELALDSLDKALYEFGDKIL